jgi:hypothetical protein
MPKLITDYSKTIIYKLCCNDINITDIYIGHTTNFTKRKNCHKRNTYNENDKKYNIKVYQFIRENGGWDNWSMIMVEEYSCNSKLEAEKRERELIEELKASLNCIIPTRNKKEYYQDKKEHIKIVHKKYYINNNDKLKEKDKEYYENNKEIFKVKYNCECGGCYTFKNKNTHFKTKIHQDYIKKT